jgi:hypothetical protein
MVLVRRIGKGATTSVTAIIHARLDHLAELGQLHGANAGFFASSWRGEASTRSLTLSTSLHVRSSFIKPICCTSWEPIRAPTWCVCYSERCGTELWEAASLTRPERHAALGRSAKTMR